MCTIPAAPLAGPRSQNESGEGTMATFTLTHEINCDEETFWKLFLDKEFNEHLYKEGLGFPEFSVVEQVETDTEIKRKTAAKPKITNMPGPVANLIGDGFR